MYQQPTTNLIIAMQSIATLNTKERDLLLATLGTPQQPTTNNKSTTKPKTMYTKQYFVNSVVKKHNKKFKQNPENRRLFS